MLEIGGLKVEPGVILGPMAGVTDLAFRTICREHGCGMVTSEMISTRALKYQDDKTIRMLKSCPEEQPLSVQIFGSDPEIMAEGAKKIEAMGVAAVIDINMGCPAPKIVRGGDGCALMKQPELAAKIINAVVRAVKLPVTVKFRKGYDETCINGVEFAYMAQESGAAAVCVHGRTRAQFYSGNADWEFIRQVKNRVSIPVIGNGDVFLHSDIDRMKQQTGCDGVMIARGALGNPFIFSSERPEKGVVLQVAVEHLKRIIEEKGEYIGIREARKHMSWYVKGMHGAAKAKDAINSALTLEQMEQVLNSLAGMQP